MTSTIKVNNIQNQCGQNIINENSNTITIGASGDTIALASGASQSGFGRSGSVDWQTTPKTSTFTAANGEGYFVDTSSGAVTVNLPAGSAGAIVAFADYTRTFATHNLTVTPNGSNKIGGVAADAKLNVNGQAATFVFVDSTEGWINVQNAEDTETGSAFIVATGGTVTESGNFKIHTFTGPGTFCVSQLSTTPAQNTVGYMVIAGGASGGSECAGGGGGAGGYREGRNVPVDNFTASPLVADAPTNAVTVTASAFPITVGAGGASQTPGPGSTYVVGNKGSDSTFSTITSAGGGGGMGTSPSTPAPARNGGSGGGGGHTTCSQGAGSGNTPSTTPPQGNDGGLFTSSSPSTNDDGGGGGGGAGGAGVGGPGASPIIGQGGAGVSSEITGSAVTRASGGSAGMRNSPGGQPNVPVPAATGGGGTGGGNSSYPRPTAAASGGAATANTGGGGGGGARGSPGSTVGGLGVGGTGGSGIVVIRYKFQ